MCVGGLPMIVEIEIGGIQKFWLDKTIGRINIEVPTGMGLGGTMDSRTGKDLTRLIVDSIVITEDKLGLTHVLHYEINTGDKPPVVSKPYRYDRVKQRIIDYHVKKMLKEDNLEAYRFAVNYRKLNAIIKYPRYPLPLIEDLITNILHTEILSSLDLLSGYFQLAVKTRDVVKTAFVTKTDIFAFTRMSFGLSDAAPNFQKAIDIILKPVLGRFVSVYMDNVIISSPLFAQHVEHLWKVFRLLQEAGLTLNKDKCKFGCDKLKYLGLVISKEGITTDESKVKAIIEMKPPKNSKEVLKFLGMTQWYGKFIKNYADLCEAIYQLKKKFRKFSWSEETQGAFDAIKKAISEASVLKLPDFNKPLIPVR
ncbi:retrovirus-related Pol polyprotein from transposon 297 [Trichonephila clavipes]|nr:retrovirus-related Pol polyprotein from transposon 297 [Trichonephila clavipes]